jgi:DNA modification methylase
MMKPNLFIKYIPIEQLIPYAGNARTHSRQQIEQIARSIDAFGFINPVLVDAQNKLVAGHARLLAAKTLGLKIIPAIRIDYLSETEKRAYMLADNKLAENAGWDPELLKIELTYLNQLDVEIDVELSGFSMPEIDLILGAAVPNNDEPPLPALPSAGDTIVQLGDLWQLGPHRLVCGDCREAATVARLMSGQQARLIFTDPPYNVPIDGHARGLGQIHHPDFAMACGEMSAPEFVAFLVASLGRMAAVSLPGSLHYVCMDWRHIEALLAAGREVYDDVVNLCIWNKSSGGMGSLYRSKHELVFVFKHGRGAHINNVELGRHGRNRTNVWDYPGANAFGEGRDAALAMHPTVKPVALIADAILDASGRHEIVLDGFAGSGSTLLAAEQTGRVFHGIEIDPRYVEVTLKRWLEKTGEPPIHVDSGLNYAERAERLAARSGQREA